jgi:hypothetical protein
MNIFGQIKTVNFFWNRVSLYSLGWPQTPYPPAFILPNAGIMDCAIIHIHL